MAVTVEALLFIVIGQSCSEGCGFDSHYRPSSFLRFNFQPILSSPYCVTWNKGCGFCRSSKLWLIIETLVVSENDGITVRQTVAHTIQLWPHGLGAMWFTPFEEKGTIIHSVSKSSSHISGAGPYDTTTTDPRWGVYNAWGLINTQVILYYITTFCHLIF